ncbi:MAG: beta-methylgalactoside transporter, partial [Lachnospiraceae bacterium]|nr:beta-methylgalactoside transporter [Lachnospiraceae bacterium]
IAGFFFGLGGALEAARTGGAQNNYGLSYEFDAISACTVGGVSMNGGVGAVPGVIIGVLIFILIQYGLNFIGINPYWQNVVKGALIVIAVAIDARKYAKRR